MYATDDAWYLECPFPWGTGNPIWKWRGCSSYLLGVKICRLAPLRVRKSKMTTVKNYRGTKKYDRICQLICLVLCKIGTTLIGVKICLSHAYQNRFRSLLQCFSKFSDEHSSHFYRWVLPFIQRQWRKTLIDLIGRSIAESSEQQLRHTSQKKHVRVQ